VAEFEIAFGGYQPPASVHSRAAAVFGAALAARGGDAARCTLAGNIIDAGHKAADLLTMVESGALSLCYFSTSYLAGRVPEFALLDLPFTVAARDRAYAILDGEFGRLLAARLQAASGYRLLGFWDNGFRHFSNRHHPIRSPADCNGLRIRTLFSDLHGQVFRRLGFEPVALDVKDLLTAVAAGTIDAQENPLTNTYNFGLHAHHRHITLSSHFFGAAALLCNNAQFESWPAAVQDAVLAAAAEATGAQRTFAAEEDASILAKLAGTEAEIVTLTGAERAAFVAAVAPLIDEQRQIFGDALFHHFT
jgi:C4-dicarboxylate-binding protein DctP